MPKSYIDTLKHKGAMSTFSLLEIMTNEVFVLAFLMNYYCNHGEILVSYSLNPLQRIFMLNYRENVH